MDKEKILYLMNTYIQKERTKKSRRKCFFRYFFDGFFNFISPPNYKYCPHCCQRITEEEYMEGYVFSFGCDNCEEKKDI